MLMKLGFSTRCPDLFLTGMGGGGAAVVISKKDTLVYRCRPKHFHREFWDVHWKLSSGSPLLLFKSLENVISSETTMTNIRYRSRFL